MTLDQALAAATDPTAVFVGPAQRRAELQADIDAVTEQAFASRPGILRRIASLLADELPHGVDRLVTAEDSASIAVTTALALHTGLPLAFAANEIHRGERVVVVLAVATTEKVKQAAEGLAAEVLSTLAVVGDAASHTLFERKPR
jgi:hypothetical protein